MLQEGTDSDRMPVQGMRMVQTVVSRKQETAVNVLPTGTPMSIKATARPATETCCLVEIIELKWLMAGHGLRLHVEQLQLDREYARRILDQADGIANTPLRESAARLRLCLGL